MKNEEITIGKIARGLAVFWVSVAAAVTCYYFFL